MHADPLSTGDIVAPAVSSPLGASRTSTQTSQATAAASRRNKLAEAACAGIATMLRNPLLSDVSLAVRPAPDSNGPPSPTSAIAAYAGGIRTAGIANGSVPTPSSSSAPIIIPAHRAILAAGSATFRAMFESGMAEAAADAVIPMDYTEDVVDCVLHYLYCGPSCVDRITPDTAMAVLDASCYYQLDALRDVAVDAVRDMTTSDNVVQVLAAALRYHSAKLRDYCVGFIRQHNTDVLDSPQWLMLPLEVAVLLVRETVIDSDLNLLRRCAAWCHATAAREVDQQLTLSAAPAAVTPPATPAVTFLTADPGANSPSPLASPTTTAHTDNATAAECVSRGTSPSIAPGAALQRVGQLMQHFLPYINFTAMTIPEIDEVEQLGCVSVEALYRAFKNHALGGPQTWTPRHGGILLQWSGVADESAAGVSFENNHVQKTSHDFEPRTVVAMNKFSAGKHYWHFSVRELRTQHDCLVGVRTRVAHDAHAAQQRSPQRRRLPVGSDSDADGSAQGSPDMATPHDVEIYFEPCCTTLTAIPSSGLRVVKHDGVPDSILQDYSCVVGVLVDLRLSTVSFYDHVRKLLLYTVHAEAPFPGPLHPAATLFHRTNGGVVMSDTTTYPGEPVRHAAGATAAASAPRTPKAGPSPIKTPLRAQSGGGTPGQAGVDGPGMGSRASSWRGVR